MEKPAFSRIECAPLPGDVQLHGAAPAEAQLSRPGAVDAHAAARALLQGLSAQQRVCSGLFQSIAAVGAVADHFRRQTQHCLSVQLHTPCRGNGHRVQHRLPFCLAAPQQLPGQVARQHQVRRQQHQQHPVAYFSPFHAFSSEAPRGPYSSVTRQIPGRRLPSCCSSRRTRSQALPRGRTAAA